MTVKKQLALGAAFACLALGVSGAAQAATTVVFTDNFDSPSSPGYSYGGTDTAGAVFGAGTGLQADGSAFNYVSAPSASQTAHIQSVGSFTETFGSLILGKTYTVSFMDAARSGYGVDGVTVSYNGNTIYTGTPASTAFNAVNSFTFVYDGSHHDLTIGGTTLQGNDAGSNALHDYNVAVDNFSISAVPEPATWALMLLGFGGLGVALRAGRKSQAAVAA